MIKDSTENLICPSDHVDKLFCGECKRYGSLVSVVDIIKTRKRKRNEKKYQTRFFCEECKHSTPSRHYRRGRMIPRIPKESLQSVSENLKHINRTILVPSGITQFLDPAVFAKTLHGQFGYVTREHKAPMLTLGAYNTWNNIVGYTGLTKKRLYPTAKKSAMALLLAHRYDPKYLFIVDNPWVALAVRYHSLTALEKTSGEAASVMVLLPGKAPHLEVLQNAHKVCAITNDPRNKQYLVENLPCDAILMYGSMQVAPDKMGDRLRSILEKGKTLNEQKCDTTVNLNS